MIFITYNYWSQNLTFKYNSRIFVISIFSALASLLTLLEIFIVLPIPFIKIGLANSITLYFLYKKEYKIAVFVTIFRLFIGNFFAGKLFSIPMVFSFSAGLFSLLVSFLVFVLFNKYFSISVVSISGAVTHNITQLFLFYYIINVPLEVNSLLSILIAFSILSGLVVAYISDKLLNVNVNLEFVKDS